MLTVTFVRKRGLRDHVYVTRGDATTVDWAFPSYGDGLPHDLCHLVVEDVHGLSDGFWGLVADHVDVRLVDNQSTLIRHGRPLSQEPGVDLSGLSRAEEVVALMAGPTGDVGARPVAAGPDGVAPGAAAAISGRLRELGRQWRTLEDGGALIVTFGAGDS